VPVRGRVRIPALAAALAALTACADTAPTTPVEPTAVERTDAAIGLREDPRCTAAGPRLARQHAAAAARVRGALALDVSPAAFSTALDALAVAQRACFEGLTPVQREAALESLRWALLQDLDEPRADRGGVPSLPWRLLQDGAVRATASVGAAEAARDAGAPDIALLRLVEAQRARLVVMPELLRFVDEARRSEILFDPVLAGWLGVPP
jgi:hypothetical protein